MPGSPIKKWTSIIAAVVSCRQIKNLRQSLVLGLLIVLLVTGCSPEGDDPKPNNYIIEGPQDLYPAFSPDGNSIVYYHDAWDTPDPPGYPSGLYIVDKNGQNRRLVLEGNYQSPSWSPNGDWLVFSINGSLHKCTVDGDSLTRFDGLDSLPNPGTYFPSWSKNGEQIVFDKALNPGYGMYITSPDFKDIEALFDLIITGRDAELSSDGSFVLYERGGGGVAHTEIFKASLSDQQETQLTKNNRDNRAATWSIDGSKIAWSANLELYIMNSDGSDQRRIGYGSDPSWSPGNEIVVSHANENYTKEVLYVTTLDGVRVQITH